MKKYVLSAILISTLFSCNLGSELKEAIHLSSELKEKYHCDEVNVSINNGSNILITMQNSIYQDSAPEVKQRVTNEISQIVLADKKLGTIKEGSVLFSVTNGAGPVTTSTGDSFDMNLQRK